MCLNATWWNLAREILSPIESKACPVQYIVWQNYKLQKILTYIIVFQLGNSYGVLFLALKNKNTIK